MVILEFFLVDFVFVVCIVRVFDVVVDIYDEVGVDFFSAIVVGLL